MNSNNPLKSLDHWEDDLLERYPEKKKSKKKPRIPKVMTVLSFEDLDRPKSEGKPKKNSQKKPRTPKSDDSSRF